MISCHKCTENALILQDNNYWCAPCRLNHVGIKWPPNQQGESYMPKKKKNETIQDILDRIEEDLNLIREKADEMDEVADIDEDEDEE